MAMHNVTTEVHQLLAMGVTVDQLDEKFGAEICNIDYPDINGGWEINSRSTEARLTRWLAELQDKQTQTERAEDLAQGHLVEWRKVSGQWCIAGAGLVPGAMVTVTRRNGTESLEVVGRIVSENDGIVYATVGQA